MRHKRASGQLSTKQGPKRDREVVRRVCDWFAAAARDLPWRVVDPKTGLRDPFHSLVSEFMLQQTQVSRVLEKFEPFLARFPDVGALARADLSEVLSAWSGLGYYRRARNLHGAAKAIANDFGAQVPRAIDPLMSLPGVGRYTAGAIASMVFGQREPLVDGNVARVLLRVEGHELSAPEGLAWAWTRASELVLLTNPSGKASPGPFNEGLMELGATVCTPASPRCAQCPLSSLCVARQKGLQSQIPSPKIRPTRTAVIHSSILVRDPAGRLLMERRPEKGLWAGMWQAPTLETKRPPTPKRVAAWLGVAAVRRLGGFIHHTTHRAVEFVVWDGGAVKRVPETGADRRWMESTEGLAMGNAQRRVLNMADAGIPARVS